MKATLFFSPHCPDTAPFVAELERLGVEYEPADILGSMGWIFGGLINTV